MLRGGLPSSVWCCSPPGRGVGIAALLVDLGTERLVGDKETVASSHSGRLLPAPARVTLESLAGGLRIRVWGRVSDMGVDALAASGELLLLVSSIVCVVIWEADWSKFVSCSICFCMFLMSVAMASIPARSALAVGGSVFLRPASRLVGFPLLCCLFLLLWVLCLSLGERVLTFLSALSRGAYLISSLKLERFWCGCGRGSYPLCCPKS